MLLSVEILLGLTAYAFALWLGAYLIARDISEPRLALAGLGLGGFALAIASNLLASTATSPAQAAVFLQLERVFVFLPALFWSGTLGFLLPEGSDIRILALRVWRYGVLPVGLFMLLLGAGSGLLTGSGAENRNPAFLVYSFLLILPLLAGLGLVLSTRITRSPRLPFSLILAATLFFSLGTGLLLFPLDLLPRFWVLLGIGFDLILLGLAIAMLDAFEQGESLRADMVYSLGGASLITILFGGQVIIAMALWTGASLGMLALLLTIVATAVLWQSFSDPLQAAIDRIAYPTSPQLRQSRLRLRAANSALPRLKSRLDLEQLSEEEFTRLTRRALSQFNNLPRLISNPLTHMTLVEIRLAERGEGDGALERAGELRTILAESIERLKPSAEDDFGTTEDWRFYNALYFPYVVGLRPYSRRFYEGNELDEGSRRALDWFNSMVPERTLYNWQTAAARLVAQDLREQELAKTARIPMH